MCQSFKILDFFECVQQSKAFDGIYRERKRFILGLEGQRKKKLAAKGNCLSSRDFLNLFLCITSA